MPKPLKLSPSTLNLFADCPRCFWNHFNGKKRPNGPFPSLPGGMDKVLKVYCESLRAKGKMLPELAKEGLKFYETPLMKEWQNNFKGIRWTDPENGVILGGAVDEMLIKGKELIVLDFKTRGWPCKEDTHKYYILQMSLYNLLLRKNGYKTPNYAYLLFFYPKEVHDGNKVDFNTELKKVKIDIKHAERVFGAAVKCLKSPEPHDEHKCHWCDWENGG